MHSLPQADRLNAEKILNASPKCPQKGKKPYHFTNSCLSFTMFSFNIPKRFTASCCLVVPETSPERQSPTVVEDKICSTGITKVRAVVEMSWVSEHERSL